MNTVGVMRCAWSIFHVHGRRGPRLVDDLKAGIRRKRGIEYEGVVGSSAEGGIGHRVRSGRGWDDGGFSRGAKYVMLLLGDGVNFVLVILLVGSGGFFSLQFFLELIETLELAMGPSGYAVLAALLLESGDANAQLLGGGVYGEMKAARQVLVGEGSPADILGGGRGCGRTGRLYSHLAALFSMWHWRGRVAGVIAFGRGRCVFPVSCSRIVRYLGGEKILRKKDILQKRLVSIGARIQYTVSHTHTCTRQHPPPFKTNLNHWPLNFTYNRPRPCVRPRAVGSGNILACRTSDVICGRELR